MPRLRVVCASVFVSTLFVAFVSCHAAKRPAPPIRATCPAPQGVTTDLVDYRVVQRDEHDEGTLLHTEPCDLAGTVFARVLIDDVPVEGLDWQPAGQSDRGVCSAMIPHVPVGGPYRVELQVRSPDGETLLTRSADNILVGDLWALPGQSNMLGWGDLAGAEEPSPWVHTYGLNEQWSIAREPLHWTNESPDGAHHPGKTVAEIDAERHAPRENRTRGAGLGLPFAKELSRRINVPIGLVPCAQGGTCMDQWSPDAKDLGGASLYGSLLRRIRAVGGRVRGVLWYQGEDDAHPNTCSTYRGKFVRFIQALRRDLNDPQLPFYYVQIGRTTEYPRAGAAWSAIREDQRTIPSELPGVFAVGSIDLDLDDHIHIGTEGLKRLGRRLAVVAAREAYGRQSLEDKTPLDTGPHLVSVAFTDAKHNVIRVTFDHVNGRLAPPSHIGGFSLLTPDGKPGPEFFDVIVDPNAPNTVLCQLESPVPPGCTLWYGHGRNPYCNLVDSEDMAALAFGPIALPAR